MKIKCPRCLSACKAIKTGEGLSLGWDRPPVTRYACSRCRNRFNITTVVVYLPHGDRSIPSELEQLTRDTLRRVASPEVRGYMQCEDLATEEHERAMAAIDDLNLALDELIPCQHPVHWGGPVECRGHEHSPDCERAESAENFYMARMKGAFDASIEAEYACIEYIEGMAKSSPFADRPFTRPLRLVNPLARRIRSRRKGEKE